VGLKTELNEAAMDIENLDAMLQKAFDESSKIYRQRGFQRRIGFGCKPAIVSVDLANAWTRPGNPFSCDMAKMDGEIIPGMQRLLQAARNSGHVVVHVTTAYQNTNRNDPHNDMGMWHHKIPVEAVNLDDKELWSTLELRPSRVNG
jgi:N-carbamoylsarcosine amidase